jgi:pimeloyl-ACP methyl ester carboxylesterase
MARLRLGVALPAERTAVFGVSASGELALAVGLRHPHIYGAVFCASPGSAYRPRFIVAFVAVMSPDVPPGEPVWPLAPETARR